MKKLCTLLFLIVLFMSYSCKKDNISDFIDSSQIKTIKKTASNNSDDNTMRTPNGNTKEQVAMKIANYLTTQKDVPLNTTVDASYKDDLGFTDVDIWELILFLEQEFDLNISDQQARLIKTIQNSFDICFTQLIEQVDVNGFSTTIGIDWRDNFNWESLTNGSLRNGDNTSSSSGSSSTNFTMAAPVLSIDLKKRLDCFKSIPDDSNTKYKITLNAHKGIFGGQKPGHAFITLEKSNGNNFQRLSYGFYPEGNITSIFMLPVNSAIGEESVNQNRQSDSRYVLDNLTKSTFDNIISKSIELSKNNYDLNDNNCVHYATDIFNIANPPTGIINNTGFATPDDLNNYIRTLKSISGNNSIKIETDSRKPLSSTNCSK